MWFFAPQGENHIHRRVCDLSFLDDALALLTGSLTPRMQESLVR